MTSRWRKQLLKVADLSVEIPLNDIVWPQCNHEPLIIAVILPLHSSPRWKLKHTKFVNECEMKLQTVWKDKFSIGGHLLCKLWNDARTLDEFPVIMMREMLQNRRRGEILHS